MRFNKKLAALVAMTVITSTLSNISVTNVNATTGESISIVEDNNTIVIGNEYMERVFSIENNKLSTLSLNNKRANNTFEPSASSEEFVIGLLNEVDRGWSIISQSSQETVSESGYASNAIDGDISTIWHTKYNGGVDAYPHHLAINLGEEKNLAGFSYTPRQSGNNGDIKDYEFYVSNDGENWGEPIKDGTFTYNGKNKINVTFDEVVSGQYIKLVGLNSVNGQNFAACAELDIIEQGVTEEDTSKFEIKSSDLTIADIITEDSAEGKGKKVKFVFDTVNKNGVNWDIAMNVVMEEGDHFMRKYLEISCDDPTAKIDYIDLESLTLNDSVEQQWAAEETSGAMMLNAYQMSLGQPIYIDGMFMGCEFPVTDNKIASENGEEVAKIKYYSGREFEDLEKTTDGKFVTWQTVVGAARSTDESVIQTDFFEYIDEIATRTDFRKQYNSWYDHMMNITAENIEGSFYEIEKGLSQFGVEPLDSYVVDDGWNDYTANFWSFNNKFPNELYDSKEQAQNFGSNFGLWLGPRGGYNYNSSFGQNMEAAGTGGYNPSSGDICVGDHRYVENITNLFLDYMDRFDINYWKIDGNVSHPCPRTNHGHVTGGYKGMHMLTETWEAWIDIFAKMREFNPDVFINLTCYVNPSPWFLQWVNTVWLQNSQDVGFTGGAVDGSMMDAMITYRDGRYNDFYRTRELQFPAANIYNHDPINGNTNKVNGQTVQMSEEQFEKYLYMIMTRGTSFWELYYSFNLMNEGKWMVNSEVLKWGEENFDILRNAKLIGENAESMSGIYGYSAWNGDEGVVSLRNPSATTQTYTITLDRLIGVGEGSANMTKSTVYPYGVPEEDTVYNYGDTIEVTLKPYEVVVWQFGDADTTSADVVEVKAEDANTVLVEFNERVLADAANYSIEGNTITNAEILMNRRTVKLTLENSLEIGQEYTININNASDLAENTTTKNVSFKLYEDNKLIVVKGKADLKNADSLVEGEGPAKNVKSLVLDGNSYEVNSDNAVSGVKDFGVSMVMNTTDSNAEILSQGEEYALSINENGNVEFTSNGVTAVSKAVVNDGQWNDITAVRENNGLLKVYVNGVLDNSAFDENKGIADIKAKTITVGSENFTGAVSNIVIRDEALSYDEVETVYEEDITGVHKIPQSQMNVSATSEEVGSEVNVKENAIDGNTSTFWQSAVAKDNTVERQYLTLDLGKLYNVSQVDYTGRYHESLGLNCTGNILEYVVETSADGETWTEASRGATSSESATTEIKFDAVEAQYVRISADTTYHWQDANRNKTVSVAELNVYGEEVKEQPEVPEEEQPSINMTVPVEITVGKNFDLNVNLSDIKDNMYAMEFEVDYDETKVDFVEAASIDTSKYIVSAKANEGKVKVIVAGMGVALENTKDIAKLTFTAKTSGENVVFDLINGKVADGEGSEEATKPSTVATTIKDAVNKGELTTVIEEAKNIIENESDKYTEASIDVLKDMVALAEEVIANETATQEQVNEAREALENAIAALEEAEKPEVSVDKTALQITIEYANELKGEGALEGIVPAVVKEFNEALAEAEALYANESVTEAEVKASFDRLSKAIQMLEFKAGDKSALQTLVNAANALSKDNYTEESLAKVEAILGEANEVLADENAMQEEIDEVAGKLQQAIEELEEATKLDKTLLQGLIDRVQGTDASKYIESTWIPFANAIDAANAILANKNATQEEVNSAYNTLLRAYLNLRLAPDKSLLEDLIKEVQSLDLSRFTSKSVKSLEKAMKKADKVVNNEKATQVEIDEALENLKEAKDSLVAKENNITSNGNNESNINGNSNNLDSNNSNGSRNGNSNTIASSSNSSSSSKNGSLPKTGTTGVTGVLMGGAVSLLAGLGLYRRKK